MWTWIERMSNVMIVVAVLIAGVAAATAAEPEVMQGNYQTACYRTGGGDLWVCDDGGTLRVMDGGTLELQAGSTLTSSGTISLTDATASGTITGEHLVSTDDAVIGDSLSTTSLTASGDITAVNGTLSGDLGVVNVTATGDLTGVNGTLSGDLGVAGVNATGDVSAANGTYSGDLDVGGTITYGSGDLYPLGMATNGYAIYCGQSTVTGTHVVTSATHGITTPVAVLESMATAPGATAGDPFLPYSVWSGSTITITVAQDDGTDATDPAQVDYCIIGED